MKHFTRHFLSFSLVITSLFFFTKTSSALIFPFNLNLSGANENPPNISKATGNIAGTYDDGTKTISFTETFSGMTGPTTAAHFHAAAGTTQNAPVRIGFAGFPTGVISGSYSNSFVLTAQQEGWLLTDSMYANIHSSIYGGGEIRVQMILDSPLPVELSSFVSVINKNNVTLNWTTSLETNNSGFEIQRSASNSEWTKVGFVAGAGNSSGSNNYAFSDRSLNAGNYDYRLKQIDFNGNYEYFNLSNEVRVGVPTEYNLSQNYPNPFNPTTKIDFELPYDGKVRLVLFDVSGKEVMTIANDVRTAGYYSVSLNASSLSSGIYFYTINSNNFVSTKKLMLVK